jgi:hypothetical protein
VVSFALNNRPTSTKTERIVIRIIAGPTLKLPSSSVAPEAACSKVGTDKSINGNIIFFMTFSLKNGSI